MRSKLDNTGKMTQEETGGEIIIYLKLISIFMKMLTTGITRGTMPINGAKVSLSYISTAVYIFLFDPSLPFDVS